MDFADLVYAGILSRVRRLAKAPAIHFLLLGGVLLLADAAWSRLAASLETPTIVLTAEDVAQLRRSFQQQYGRTPGADEERALVDHAIDDEVLYRRALAIGLDRQNRVVRERLVATMRLVADDTTKDEETLYREALALGLDKKDIVVRRHLVQLMALLLKRSGAAKADVGEIDLERELAREAERYRVPGRVTLTHVYFDPAKRGTHLEADAGRVLAEARAGRVAPAAAPALGDPFLLGSRFTSRSEREIRKLLGDRFADAVDRATPREWSEPVRSPYGLHLVLVEERVAEELPPIESVRNQLVGHLLEERGEDALRAKLAEMRAGYSIRVETTADAPSTTKIGEGGTVLQVPSPARELGD